MANPISINKVSPIENKIREFKEGKDYIFTGEKHHAPDNRDGTKGYITKSYDILSPELKKVLRERLAESVAILTSFDFQEKIHVIEDFRTSYYNYNCMSFDEFKNCVDYSEPKEKQTSHISFFYFERPERETETFTNNYQTAKHCYQEKFKQKSPNLIPTPPQGTKC